ncbi:uncharacterized protein LOC116840803 isoform X1 [Odontomachus brunneus]|uniref:uncharacterized protein LOC116840803 isoform X1 n=1 Tax=Odontomachus brunneus TaxID=486640 RepID=UPI0013F1A0D1|nr:uncharacterized protein LOC116840803 isoform X1 [Odontomachus brunneus]
MTDYGRKRTTLEQREIMIQFMEEHPDLAHNRIHLDARKRAAHLWEQLTNLLNSCGHGTTKCTEKWIKSWRDWRIDVKSKAAKLKSQRGTGGGGPSAVSLHETEKRLIALMGIESIRGHLNVIDPAESTARQCLRNSNENCPQNWREEALISEDLLPRQSSTVTFFPSPQNSYKKVSGKGQNTL